MFGASQLSTLLLIFPGAVMASEQCMCSFAKFWWWTSVSHATTHQRQLHAGFPTRGVVDGEERLVQLMIGPGPGAKLSELLNGTAEPML